MLFDSLLANAQRDPNRIAVIDDRGQYTTAQVAKMAVGISMMLRATTQASRVGILLPTSVGFAASFYGTLLAGKTVVPINFLLGEKEIAHIIRDSGIDTILSAPPLAERLKGMPIRVVDLTQLPSEVPAGVVPPPPPKPAKDDIAVLMYTSGTSAMPKGVLLSYGNLADDVDACIEHAQLKGDHKFLGVLPLFHSTGLLATLIAPTRLGATVCYQARFNRVAMMNAIKEHKLTILIAVPSMYGALMSLKDATPADLSHVFAAISGGEPLPGNIREGFQQRFGQPIYEGYGLTETIGPICCNVPGKHRPGSVGKLVPGATARIVGDDGQTMPQDQQGEVWLKGPMIMKGYHNLPEATADALTPDGYFKTGDLGHLDADGYLYITGRKKDLIIVAGEKAVPREIEEVLLTHPAVGQVAVLGKKDPSRGEVVVAFAVAKEGQSITGDALREHARASGLMQWKVPREVYIVTELPMSPTGKVLKRVLAEKLAAMA